MTALRIAVALLATTVGEVAAETAYVTDELRLGLHQLQDTSDRPFEVLVSGTPLEILEQLPNYSRVRTPDGQVGWVKSAYLVEEPPARYRLAQIEQQREALATQAREARAQAESSVARLAELEAELAESTARLASLEGLEIRNEELQSRLEAFRLSIRWPWALGGVALALLLGFLAGRAWVERQLRKRFGGLRVF